MKKVFLLSLGLLIGMAGFAQVKGTKSDVAKQSVLTQVMINDGSEVSAPANYSPSNILPSVSNSQLLRGGEATLMPTMTTNYDLQSNGAIGNRIAAWPDGSVAVTATWDFSGVTSFPDRGTGYNYYDGSSFGDEPETRVEPAKSGWPSICAYGDGEILVSHNTGVNVYYRATKGEGDWEFLTNLQTSERAWTWPRVAATEDGSLHLICADQYADANSHNVSVIAYYRSTDGGHTWTENPVFANLSTEYNLLISADDYVIATNGNRIAITFFSFSYDMFYMYSEDGGATWTKQIICEHPFKVATGSVFDWGQQTVSSETDSIYWNDNSGAIAIDNNGTVHVTWALGRWAPAPSSGWGYYSYWPYVIGMMYWNSNYVNEKGGHEILPYGEWSEDANNQWSWPGHLLGGQSNTMNSDRMEMMAEAEGNNNLHFYGYASENNPGDENGPYYDSDIWGNHNDVGSYRSINVVGTMPAMAVDDNNNVYILYSGLSDKRTGATSVGSTFYYRSPFLHTRSNDVWEAYYVATVIATGTAHNEEEAYSFTGYPNEVNGKVWFLYSADELFGLYLNEDQSELSDNIIYAVRVATFGEDVAETNDVVYNIYPNPATDYLCISADANAEATISFVNLAGQTVKVINKSLTVGNNSIDIDLNSGVYFCTVTANGFSKTTKIVVK